MASLCYSSLSQNSFFSCTRPTNSIVGLPKYSLSISTIGGSQKKLAKIEDTHLRLVGCMKRTPALRLEASRDSLGLSQGLTNNKLESTDEIDNGLDLFDEMKHRFLSFKKRKYLENPEQFQNLSQRQEPKFLVIACSDSRVCPSNILGFQPGEAFVVRNIANLVPPFENGPSETNAALEFSVNTLEVENILVIGHSCCGGIRALMSMEDEVNSSFIRNWVVIGKDAKFNTKAATANLDFEQQCRHCEKVSVNHSLRNLLTYPWLEERVSKGVLSIHGGYYDFVKCTFEKWTLDYKGRSMEEEGDRCSVKDRTFWC